ncbi:cysteine hydrolase family protein [Acetivibrio cellulolyticus]|uniref:cysteine hydrolase family protein n=1 Tax=Acetivibrio cellulolyticus TaxID=35830 RepID=UPI0001E2FBB4|nr:isochorismatase family cysteine hydrolase [Acetivibrio cellulolyticus]
MKNINRKEFLKRSAQTLGEIVDMLEGLPEIKLKDLQCKQTALIIVDMINGFAREGALKSPRVEDLIPEIVKLSKKCTKMDIKKVAFADCHTEASPEFGAYPEHCMVGTSEAEIVDEIKEVGGYKLIPKNSTNGFHEEEFKKWLEENPQLNTFIITGDCTDICVQQFAITLKTWFNMQNKKYRVIVPVNAVETYDLGLHNGDLMNVMALYNMVINGIELVREIEI